MRQQTNGFESSTCKVQDVCILTFCIKTEEFRDQNGTGSRSGADMAGDDAVKGS